MDNSQNLSLFPSEGRITADLPGISYRNGELFLPPPKWVAEPPYFQQQEWGGSTSPKSGEADVLWWTHMYLCEGEVGGGTTLSPCGTFPPLISSQPRSARVPQGWGCSSQHPGSTRPKLESKSRCSKGHANPGKCRRAIAPSAPWGCHHSIPVLAQDWALVASATPQGLCQSNLWGPRDIWQGGGHCNSTSLSLFVLLCCTLPSAPTWIRRIWKADGLCVKDPLNKQQMSNNWFNK